MLELVAPNLRHLTLSGDMPDDGYDNLLEGTNKFPNLRTLECTRVALTIYEYITHSVPKLQYLELARIGDFEYEESVLANLPTSIIYLKITDMNLTSDPPESLLANMRRLPNLTSLPKLQYREEEDEQVKPDLGPIKEALFAHFDGLPIPSTEDARKEIVRVFGINE